MAALHPSCAAACASFAGDKGEAQDFTWTLAWIDDDHFSSTLVAPAHGKGRSATFHAVYTRATAK